MISGGRESGHWTRGDREVVVRQLRLFYDANQGLNLIWTQKVGLFIMLYIFIVVSNKLASS